MPRHPFEPHAGRIDSFRIDSPALAKNTLGDPAERTIAVYLPPGYDDTDDRYPLLVDLAGFTGSGLKHLGWQGFGESLPQRIDRLCREKLMGPAVFAFPDAFTSLGGNQYVDSPILGGWATFLTEEMVPELERRYRLLTGAKHRALFGKSSGGYGALYHGMHHADCWGAVACHSGDIDFEIAYRRDLYPAADRLARHEHRVDRFLDHLRESSEIGGGEMHTLMTLAMAATYDPHPDEPFGVKLPIDLRTGRLDPARWEAWRSWDPLVMVERDEVRENLKRLSGLFVDCGFRDQYFLHFGARALTRRLEELGIAHRYEEFDGTHSRIDHRMDVSLPYLYGRIAG